MVMVEQLGERNDAFLRQQIKDAREDVSETMFQIYNIWRERPTDVMRLLNSNLRGRELITALLELDMGFYPDDSDD